MGQGRVPDLSGAAVQRIIIWPTHSPEDWRYDNAIPARYESDNDGDDAYRT